MRQPLEQMRLAVRQLKVFPLPSVVLLPGTALPLHIFEPRYRSMVEESLSGDRVIAMAQVLPGQERQLGGTPVLESMLCAGLISLSERLEDGCFNIMLTGVARARILRELPKVHSFREVEAELLEDPTVDRAAEEPLRRALVELLARLPPEVAEGLAAVTARVHGGALADIVAAAAMPDASQRFEILSTLDVGARLRAVTDEVLLLMAGLTAPGSGGLLN